MPLGDTVGEFLGGPRGLFGQMVAEVVLEILIKVPGSCLANLILKPFGKRTAQTFWSERMNSSMTVALSCAAHWSSM